MLWVYLGGWLSLVGEPGRLVDKDGGLWSLRPEFESPPGYQCFCVCMHGGGRGGCSHRHHDSPFSGLFYQLEDF